MLAAMDRSSWYDFPRYYDLAFRSETRAEVAFIEAACHTYCASPVRRIVEPGCGGGRLVVALSRRGYDVTGFDLNTRSLEFARRRLRRCGLDAHVFEADMADFRLARPVDAAVCTWNTFRHLLTERAARCHLECVARCLRPGGIYILGLHLLPLDVSEESTERWTARHGRTRVTVTLRVISASRRRRVETLRLNMRVRSPRRELRLRHEFQFRMYTANQFLRLLAAVPQFELCDVYDFWFDINEPLELNDEITDTVFVLRRR
jgi:SAM-dependent methyltransferase